MIAVGQTVRDARGARYVVTGQLGTGGQGTAFAAREAAGGRICAVKAWAPGTETPEAAARLDALIRFAPSSRSPALCGPEVRLDAQHGLGAVMPLALGRSLDEAFAAGAVPLVDALGAGAGVCAAVAVLETFGVAHGDLAAANVHTSAGQPGELPRVQLIDFDNAAVPGAPRPPLLGQKAYAAAELLGGAPVSVASDRFALAVLLHELLLARHPFGPSLQGLATAPQGAFLRTAAWPEDPLSGNGPPPPAGAPPVRILSRRLHDLFRLALQPDPSRRPTAAAWRAALEASLGSVFACDSCGGMFVNEPTSFHCPYDHCRALAPPLALEVGGRRIVLGALVTAVGRADLGGDPHVSREHAHFCRRGFAASVACASGNGLAVFARGQWAMLRRGEEAEVGEGDRVRFAPGVEGTLRIA